MSLDVLTAIWRDPPCKGGDLLCLLAIADNADEKGYAWPSIETISRKAAMSERGAQKCLQKLQNAGLISIHSGGGRGKTNAYQITTNGIGESLGHNNPEQNSPNRGSPFTDQNPEQCDINPEQCDAKPRTPVHPNSQEPSKEPLLPPKSPKSILCQILSEEAADNFIANRKAMRKPFTERAAVLLVGRLEEIRKQGGSPSEAVDMAIEYGWQGVEASWYFRRIADRNQQQPQTNGGGNDQSPQQSNRVQRIISAAAEGSSGQDWG